MQGRCWSETRAEVESGRSYVVVSPYRHAFGGLEDAHVHPEICQEDVPWFLISALGS